MIQTRTDTDCFPWYCSQCKESGILTIDQPTMPGEISQAALKAHAAESPRCNGTVKLVSARYWYRQWPPVAPDAERINRQARNEIADLLGKP